MKKYVFGLLTGLLISGSIVYAATLIDSKDVTYTPSDNNFDASNVEGALNKLYDKINVQNNNPTSIGVLRGSYTILKVNAKKITFTQGNSVYSGNPSPNYPAQWYIAGSNDLTNWTTLCNYTWTSQSSAANTYTVDIDGYQYIKFTSSGSEYNYVVNAYFNNIKFE